MKKILVMIVLVTAVMAAGQEAAPQPQAQPAAPQQKKEIKEPAEYNAYVGAVQQQDAAAKISGLEAFLVQYPNSVMKEDALELLMGAYQQSGNGAKMGETANRLLGANPDNVRALALLAYTERATQKWPEARQHAERGLQALPKMPKPEGVAEADFAKQKTQLAGLLNSVAGFSALQAKDYPASQKFLRAAVEANPNNLEDVYPLALAYLTATPADDVNGTFFIARAANLAQDPKGKEQIVKFGRSRYVKYHGSDQGWSELLAQTATTLLPPAGFTITKYVPPTPAEQAAELVKSKDPKKMSFAEWQLVLSEGNPADAQTVWNAIKGQSLIMEAPVMKASATKLEIAATEDDIAQKRADIVLEMAAPLPLKLVPKEGQTIDFEGTPVSYEAKPFVMTMNKGALLTKAAPPAPKKPPVRKRPTR